MKPPAPDLDHIEPGLRPLAVPLDRLGPNPRQVNTHDERSIAAIARSLTRHGQKKSIVANAAGAVVAGWGTVLAARQIGWTHLAVIFSEEDAATLDEYALEDNRTAQLGAFDDMALLAEIGRLADLGVGTEDLGWDIGEMAKLIAALGDDDPDLQFLPDSVLDDDPDRDSKAGGTGRAVTISVSIPSIAWVSCRGQVLTTLGRFETQYLATVQVRE